MSSPAALSGRLREYLAEVEKVSNRARTLADKALASGDDGYWDGVALNLHGFYSGIERIFEDIARSFDESIPDGPDWHSSLLLQMSAETPGRRPAVISRSTRYCLDEYRGFRHVVRNVYAFNFRPSRLQELVNNLPNCFDSAKEDLLRFSTFLENLEGKSPA